MAEYDQFVTYEIIQNRGGFYQMVIRFYRKELFQGFADLYFYSYKQAQFKTKEKAHEYAEKYLKHYRCFWPARVFIVGEMPYTRTLVNPVVKYKAKWVK